MNAKKTNLDAIITKEQDKIKKIEAQVAELEKKKEKHVANLEKAKMLQNNASLDSINTALNDSASGLSVKDIDTALSSGGLEALKKLIEAAQANMDDSVAASEQS